MPINSPGQADRSFVAAVLETATRMVLRHPIVTLTVSVIVAVVAVALALARLEFRTSRLDLLNPASTFNQRWVAYLDEFNHQDDIIIVVEGDDQRRVESVLDELAGELEGEKPFFTNILHKIDLSQVRSKGLHYLTVDQLAEIEQFIDSVAPTVSGDWSPLNVEAMMARLGRDAEIAYQHGAVEELERSEQRIVRLASSVEAGLAAATRYQSPWTNLDMVGSLDRQLAPRYMLASDGKTGFIQLWLTSTNRTPPIVSRSVDRLRTNIDLWRSRYPDVTIGLTGLPVMEDDEMRCSRRDMAEASVLSLVGVSCLFVAGFGGLRYPLMTVATLLVAIAWSFGYITLAVGHLNILSVAFGVILIGLGIDFGVHYIARYQQLLPITGFTADTLVDTARGVGPGIVTGGVTTAIAFLAAALTTFTGISELGVIAGGGILLCLAASFLVLPAMIQQLEARWPSRRRLQPIRMDRWITRLLSKPVRVFLFVVAITALLALGLPRLRYDHNLLNLQPIALESVALERRLLNKIDTGAWFAVSVARNREDALNRKSQFLSLASVARVEELASLLPDADARKSTIIARIHQKLTSLPARPVVIPVAPPDQLERTLAAMQFRLSRMKTADVPQALMKLRSVLAQLSPRDCYQRLSEFQMQAAHDLLGRLRMVQAVSNPESPRPADLPPGLAARFLGPSGRQSLRVFARGSIWDMKSLEQFVADVRRVDPNATGQPVQTYHASRQMLNSYIQAALYALIGVAVVLLLDFGRLRLALLALLPTLLGLTQMCGLLGLLGIPLNPANMIVLPLILGIGIDDGVHVVHDYLRQPRRYRLGSSTTTAIVITSLTTTVGFGSLMIAQHEGLRSLGRVLTIGVSCCLFTSLTLLPALLTWISAGRTETDDDQVDQSGSLSPVDVGSNPRKAFFTDPPLHDVAADALTHSQQSTSEVP